VTVALTKLLYGEAEISRNRPRHHSFKTDFLPFYIGQKEIGIPAVVVHNRRVISLLRQSLFQMRDQGAVIMDMTASF
jgi:hypothetical protein